MAVEAGGNTYVDVCPKELDGVTCEPPFRGITRLWGDFDTYEESIAELFLDRASRGFLPLSTVHVMPASLFLQRLRHVVFDLHARP
ncbi:unnamed protein product [Ectocarpus sp. 12 AP-2014]